MKSFNKSDVDYLWAVLFYTSIFFLLFFVLYGFKSVNDDVCTTNVFGTDKGISFLVINDNSTYQIPFSIPNKQFNGLSSQSICIEGVGSTNTYNSLTHSDTTIYVNNLTEGLTCFNNLNTSQSGYMGFKCDNCDDNDNVTISLTNNNAIILHNDIATSTNNWYYKIYNSEYCKELYKTFINIYFSVIGLIIGIFLMLRGIKWFNNYITKGYF